MDREDEPQDPGEVHTPEEAMSEASEQPEEQAEAGDGEVEFNFQAARDRARQDAPPPGGDPQIPPVGGAAAGRGPQPPLPMAGMRIAPESYDGSADLDEYLVYFQQLAMMSGWNEAVQGMMLSLSLRGAARSVLTSLSFQQRQNLGVLIGALRQNFAPTQQVQTYLSELRNRKRALGEPLPVLGRDIARLVRLAYPQADPAMRESLGINAFMEAQLGAAVEIRLHLIRGQPHTLQEAVALAMEVDAVLEAAKPKSSGRRAVQRVEDPTPEEGEKDLPLSSMAQLTKMAEAFATLQDQVKGLEERLKRKPRNKADVTCYNCGKKGHYKSECRNPPKSQGNGEGRADPQ